MKQGFLSGLLAFLLVCNFVPGARAAETEETAGATETTAAVETTAATETTAPAEETKPVRGEFQCGDDLVWSYEDGVLTITGTGAMDDYKTEAPWAKYKDEAESVILTGGVTYIGARAFKDFDELESVDFGDSLQEIGEEAFWSCEDLEEITLPASFKVFGPSSFVSCKDLKEIHCRGAFPSFRLNCLWDTYATIYFSAERPWPVSLIQELEEAFHGRIEFRASDGSDPYVPTEATTEETQLCSYPTTAATEAVTEAPTQMPTEAPTEVTVPPTETAVPETMVQPETQPTTEAAPIPTEPETPEEEGNTVKLLIIGFGAAVILTLLIAVIMVMRQLKKKGKYAA